ncbi:hypothetical protein AX769_06250 [Frondihabitans sp. PAMC 28766]|nr:hypothetical protein AX769_06250 [Frondihabitans sp. PAMC 28766]
MEGLGLPKVATLLVKRAGKSVVFTSDRSKVDLLQAFFVLLAYDKWDRASPIAVTLSQIKNLGTGQFAVLRYMLHGARWYAVRHGFDEAAEELTPAAFQPDGYRPLILDGTSLRRPLDHPVRRANVGLDPDRPNDAFVESARPSPFLLDLAEMATMWGYGGSKEWPVERLEAERERLERAMKELPGMEPLA